MRVGLVKGRKPSEERVDLTPAGVRDLVSDGHQVLFETGAGLGVGYHDGARERASGRRAGQSGTRAGQEEVWKHSEFLVKVKEPVEDEYPLLHEELALFNYLHLAPNRALTEALKSSGACAIAYETVEDDQGRLPLLVPMSEIACRLATQAGAYLLQKPAGGPGLLIGGSPGVAPARVLVLGGGTAGTHAARVAVGTGAEVTLLEVSPARIRTLEEYFDGKAQVLASDSDALDRSLDRADLVVGAVLIPGARAPKLLTKAHLRRLRSNAMFVDVAIDPGGCAETSKPTSHANPTYRSEGVLHYCVTNMPGAGPSTPTRALTVATLPYVRAIAREGVESALARDSGLAEGVSLRDHRIVCEPVRLALN